MTSTSEVQPGDIFVCVPRSFLFKWIERSEAFIDRDLISERQVTGKPLYGHAGVASRRLENGELMIVEAEPAGAVEILWHHEAEVHLWSTGILPSCPQAAVAALHYAGLSLSRGEWVQTGPRVPYSFLDYAAIGIHSLHIPFPGLQQYVASTKHMICSQLADQCRLDGGSHMFRDGRWPGYVSPLDIGLLLEGIQ